MKILKRLVACAVALSMTACTAFGTFAVSAEENTETGSASETQLTRLALPNFVLASDLSFLDGEITEVSEADVFNWVEQNFEYLQSFDDYVDIIFGKTEDGDFLVLDREFYEYDDYADFIRDINDLIYNGYTINVSSNRTNEVWMQNVKGKTWTKPYSDNAGHSMTLIGFNENNDIIVSSWGDNYVIPKDFFNHLEYKSIKIYEKEKSKRSI